jgi:opacity protein-like surface antigen
MKQARLSILAVLLIAGSSSVEAQFLARPTAGVYGGILTPRGDFGNDVANGWHAGALLKARVYGPLDVRIDGNYAKLGEETTVLSSQAGDTLIIHTDGKVPFGTLNAHLNLGPDSAEYPGDNTVTPYLFGGVGIYHLDYNVTSTCKGDCGDIGTIPGKKRFGVNVGAGGSVPVFGVRAMVEGRYHRISQEVEEGGAASMITISVGLRIR